MSVVRAREISSEEEIQRIYNWMDDLKLSRPRRNISRDFADGVLIAEVLHQYFPRLVELHNYSAANSSTQKQYNWATLNKKVLRRLGLQLHPSDVDDLINAVPGAVEKILLLLQHFMAKYKKEQEGGLGVGGRKSFQGVQGEVGIREAENNTVVNGIGKSTGVSPRASSAKRQQRYFF